MEGKGIYGKLLNIQGELKAPKGQFNKYGNFYFRNAEDILEAVKPILNKHNTILLIQDDIAHIGERFYVKATAILIDGISGEQISVSAYAREEDSRAKFDAPQLTGSSSSYARKYALNGLFAIDDTKDSDTTNNGTEPAKTAVKKEPAKPVAQKEEPKEVLTLAKANNMDMPLGNGTCIKLEKLTDKQLTSLTTSNMPDEYKAAAKVILEFRNAERKD